MKIRKFWEGLDYGRVSNRVGFAVDPTKLPPASLGSEWREDKKFDEETAVSDDASFQRVIDAVHRNGFATVDKVV
jgi:hypothetical protein